MFKTYGKQADFRIVYVREAHAIDGRSPMRGPGSPPIKEHRSESDRAEAASACAQGLNLSMPMLLDRMDDAVERAYAGWPDRIYIVGKDGKIAYKGEPGPRGFRPDEAEAALRRVLGVPD